MVRLRDGKQTTQDNIQLEPKRRDSFAHRSSAGNESTDSLAIRTAVNSSVEDEDNHNDDDQINSTAGPPSLVTTMHPAWDQLIPRKRPADGETIGETNSNKIVRTRGQKVFGLLRMAERQRRTASPIPMPPDRRPTPGRITNPREVNEDGAAPVFSRGDPADWPGVRDPDYDSRSYMHVAEDGWYVEDADAPPGPPLRKWWCWWRNNPERQRWEEEGQYLEDPDKLFHTRYLCVQKGRRGGPTYDGAGYELGYGQVMKWMGPSSRLSKSSLDKMDRELGEKREAARRMAEIFFEPSAAPHDAVGGQDNTGFWRDKVSKDLGIPWHQVGVEQFEEWERRGFPKARKGEYQVFDEAQQMRMSKMCDGCVLRKGAWKLQV